MKVLSLFSGVGGFDMGLENAGMQTVFQCEWDKHANTILHKHWPTVPKWDDVSTLTGEYILQHAPVIDVVAWGSPCQDLSVAGKRAGLEGGRSGLFYEGIRIINELRKASNGKYPRISIWENVYGALNSNKGEDFEAILKEMVEAGSLLCEWRVLDAQYFGVPQRRRRVFVVAVFDSATANRCPDPLLPVTEGLQWNPATRPATRQDTTNTASASIGSGSQWAAGTSPDGDFLTTSVTSKWHKGSGGPSGSEHYNMVVEQSTTVGALAARDYKGVGNQYVAENKCVVETFTKSRRAQSATDDETWVEGKPAPTLNSFDQGDVRATTAIVFENSYRDGARIANDNVTQTLSAKMGTGGGNTPMLAIAIQDGREIEKNQNGLGVAEEGAPAYTIDQTGGQAVAYPIDTRNALRDPEKFDAQNRQGLGVGADGDPMATLTSAHVNAVAYGIQGTMIGRQDHNGPGGQGITKPDGAMYTLTKTDVHAVATTMVVRRLTPLECERLMGWPDNHTRYKADGTEQADTHRYKQCGNGVASPVAQWIGEQLIDL